MPSIREAYHSIYESCGCDHKKDKKKVKKEEFDLLLNDLAEAGVDPSELVDMIESKYWPSIKDKPSAKKGRPIEYKHDKMYKAPKLKEEAEELDEMRKMDKMAGKKSGGVQDPALRAGLKLKGQMMGGQQKKKVPGEKKPNFAITPKQKLEMKKKRERESKLMMHSPRD